MTPQDALKRQIELYRAMTGEQRLQIGLRLHKLSCDLARAGIKHQRPDASEEEIDEMLRHRIRLSYQ